MAVLYLIEILLPVTDALGRETLETVKSDLTQRFGGVTLHANIPAEGLWKDDQEVERDRIVVVEVMTEDIDRAWWSQYRSRLEGILHQEELVIRVISMDRL